MPNWFMVKHTIAEPSYGIQPMEQLRAGTLTPGHAWKNGSYQLRPKGLLVIGIKKIYPEPKRETRYEIANFNGRPSPPQILG